MVVASPLTRAHTICGRSSSNVWTTGDDDVRHTVVQQPPDAHFEQVYITCYIVEEYEDTFMMYVFGQLAYFKDVEREATSVTQLTSNMPSGM